MTTKFDSLLDSILTEFNVEDRNDPAFYDYIVILLQQFLQRNLLNPKKMGDLRKTAMQILRDGYFNFIDEENDLSFKIAFIFDVENASEKSVNNLSVKIYDLINTNEPPKTIENTHEETSITEIANYIEQKKFETAQQNDQQPGVDVPAELSQNPPSELPQATPPGGTPPPAPASNTGQYMQGN